MKIDFTSAVENVTFDHGYWTAGDLVDISVYGIANVLLGIYTINSTASVDLTSFGVITRLFFDDSSTASGVAYANVTYDLANVAAVPVPASLPLLLGGIGLIGMARRKRKSA